MLQGEKFRGYVTIDEAEQDVAGLASIAEVRPDPAAGARISRDPKDDYLLALARESSADAIVRGDADLLVLEDAQQPVVNPTTLVEGLEAEPA